MSDDIEEVHGVLESAEPSGGVFTVTVAGDDGQLRFGAGDYNPTARMLSETGLQPGDRVVAGFQSWGGLAYLGPEDWEGDE